MNIAIIDDSELISQMILKAVKPYGYIPHRIKSSDYDTKMNIDSYKLITIGTTIFKSSQYEIIKDLRLRNKNIPIVGILNGRNNSSKLTLFEAGADDVLSYPFLIKELIARMENILNRSEIRKDKKYSIDNIIVDTGSKSVRYKDDEIELRRKEYSILEYLVRNQGRTISRSELLDNVWDYRKITSSNTVDVHISNLRKKIHKEGLIKTIHGFGYKVETPKKLNK